MESILQTHRAELARALRNFNFEPTDDGRLVFPKQQVVVGGAFSHTVNGKDRQIDPNLVTNEGLNDALAVFFAGQVADIGFYIAPYSGNVTPANTLTAATFATTQTEFTNYTAATRVTWTPPAPTAITAQEVDNSASPASFTIGTGGGTLYGAALIGGASAKSATTGHLVACAAFTASRALLAADVLSIQYSFTAATM